MKKIIGLIFIFLLTVVISAIVSPASEVYAKSDKHQKYKDIWCDWIDGWKDFDDWGDWDNWGEWEDTLDEATEYLVLIGQSDGSYIAYDDIAFVTAGKYVMVKAKPLATALGMTYKTNSGHKNKKGLTLTLGQDSNVYTRNSKTYYFKDYNSYTKQTSTQEYTAEYKQLVHQEYNTVHSATLRTLVNYQYYDTSGVSDYAKLGYCGVIVYNRHAAIANLPALTKVANFSGYIAINDPGNNHNDNNNGTSYFTIKPVIITDSSYPDIKYVEASYSTPQASNTQLLDLSEVLNTFKSYNLPYGGIYGSGNCDTSIVIQGYDKNGFQVGEIKTTGNEFVFGFSAAVKLQITGTAKNLVLDFTPVTPILITTNTKLSLNQISWVFQSDGYARQYFVLADYMRFSTENVVSSYTVFRKYLSLNSYTNPDSAGAYQRVCAVLKSPYSELASAYCYINIQKTNMSINNSLVVFADPGNSVLATDYETKLVSMIQTLSKTGLNTYYPSSSWSRQLVMKLADNTVNTTYSYITVDPSYLNLDHFYDYYLTLHEMVHFYEATQTHYGFRFATWTDGNATNLAKKTLDALSVNHKDSSGNDSIDAIYKTDFNFLTQDNKNNFEAYYLNATGWDATLVGYHFTDFIQDIYGSDVVYKIMQKVYAANISTGPARTAAYDKMFTDCIKAETSQNVFQLFVEKHVLKTNWD